MAELKFNLLSEFSASTIERYWALMERRAPDECWPWLGCLDDGYGRFRANGRSFIASRIAFWLANGYDPAPLMVCHTCDFRPCQNPAHLFAATNLENIRDSMAKGRFRTGINPVSWRTDPQPIRRGETHPHAKLTEAKVIELRALHATGEWLRKDLAAKFGIAGNTVRVIVQRKGWRHIT